MLKQALWAVLGLVALAVADAKIDYRRYNNSRRWCFRRWRLTMLLLWPCLRCTTRTTRIAGFRFGGLFTFQPSELAKPVLVLFLAYFLQTRIHQMDDWKGTILRPALLPLLLIGADCEGAGPRDGFGMRGGDDADALSGGSAGEVLCDWRFWRGRAPVLYLHAVLRAVAAGADAGVSESGGRSARKSGFHILQSLIAVGNGRDSRAGIDGRAAEVVLSAGAAYGLHLRERLRGAWADRGDLVWWRCLWRWVIAGCGRHFCSTDPFARFMAFGLTTAVLIQAFFNMSVVLALVPTKGIPLPFISSGGTSAVCYAGEHGCAAEYYAGH